ncbi:MAG: two-component regulator propeller domain-containing protein, partial [Ignavibacteria bacterium]|nr:two-component regulator propeller domain-containing protein [Ignavibacteria bacterium]
MIIKHLFILLLMTLFLCAGVYSQSITFGRFTTANGLSNNTVNDVLQDQTGFIWFATDDGLNRFDGYEFKVFRHNPENENSLPDNSVWALMEDSKGKIWIGTKSGWLNCYDPVLDKFKKWKLKSDITEENSINCILEDSRNKIWIGTYRGGLYRFDPATGKTENWFNKPDDNKSLSNNYVSSILEDNTGNIWVSTYYGLNVLNPAYLQNEFVRFFNQPGNTNSISDNLVWNLSRVASDSNLIWIGTANGLTSYKTDTKVFSQIRIQNPDNLQFGNSSSSVIEEKVNNDKILWINSYAGLIRLDINHGKISRFTSDQNNPNSLLSDQINAIIKDRSNVLWIATNEGVSYFSSKTTKFNNSLNDHYRYLNDGKIFKKNIRAISKTADGRLWFGTDQGLFYTYHTNNNISINKLPGSDKINIWSLTPGGLNELWIGTYGQGLFKLDTKSDALKEIRINDKSIRSQAVNFNKYVYSDHNNNLWIGFWGIGLGCLNESDGSFDYW